MSRPPKRKRGPREKPQQLRDEEYERSEHVLILNRWPLLGDESTSLLVSGSFKGSWRILPTLGETPTPRTYAAMVLSENGDFVYLFGGFDHEEKVWLSDLWALELSSATWRQLDSSDDDCGKFPLARYGHSMSIVGNKLVVFGMMVV